MTDYNQGYQDAVKEITKIVEKTIAASLLDRREGVIPDGDIALTWLSRSLLEQIRQLKE